MLHRRLLTASLVILASLVVFSEAHDIPNARVDRSIQATLGPGKLRVDYEVSLSELTLTQDLRQLAGELPATDLPGLFDAYGKLVGPLNAKGLLVRVDQTELELQTIGFDLLVEGHPRYTFHFEVEIPERGRLVLIDTNYEASEGTSRLAIRPESGSEVSGDSLPTDVLQIPIRPVWQLDPSEERRTKRLTVDYDPSVRPSTAPAVGSPSRPANPGRESEGLSRLLDEGATWPVLWLLAFVLGAGHAIQPGHGKTLVAASTLGPGGSPFRGALLGLATALAHLSSVVLIALAVWWTRASRLGEVHQVLTRSAGFLIAAIGFWRLGRHVAGHGEHRSGQSLGPGWRSLVALGLAGGIVPCWDAVALVVVAQAIGRLTLGLTLLAAFSLGMATVLVGVGALASRFRSALGHPKWERRLGIAGGLILAGIGISLMR